jgi:GTP pyrophosphokinase
VHRQSCPNIKKVLGEKDRIVEAFWSDQVRSSFLISVQIRALDRNNLLNELLKSLHDDQISMQSINSSVSKDQVATFHIVLEMADPKRLNSVLSHLRQVDSVFEAYRV